MMAGGETRSSASESASAHIIADIWSEVNKPRRRDLCYVFAPMARKKTPCDCLPGPCAGQSRAFAEPIRRAGVAGAAAVPRRETRSLLEIGVRLAPVRRPQGPPNLQRNAIPDEVYGAVAHADVHAARVAAAGGNLPALSRR